MFWGTASISQGSIDSVEYSFDDGKTWSQAATKDGKFDEISEDYTFSLPSVFTVGTKKIITRAKSSANVYTEAKNYAVITMTISPPKITLDKISPNPSKNQTPTLTGSASSDFMAVSRVQISLDEGKTWFLAKLAGRKFSLTTKPLEDGNYDVSARVYDAAGNMSESKTQILIIDTIPPIIGGTLMALGVQILTPDALGVVRTVADGQNTITMSMRGGVTKATIDIQNEVFDLAPLQGTNLWTSKIVFEKVGEKPVKIIAIDGAGNTTEKELPPFFIEKSGRVISLKDNLPVKNAQVSLYLLEATSRSWVLWDGSSFGQKNPQKTDNDGAYNYIVPAGRYYLEVEASGFCTMRSEIFDFPKTTTLVATFPLSPKPRITLRLPILGELNFAIPLPAQTLNKKELFKPKQTTSPSLEFGLKKGVQLPNFSLPDPNGKIVNSLSLKGKSMALTFLSIWAPPSIEQTIILNQTSPLLNEKQSLSAIFLQDSPGEVETFMKRGHYNFNALIDKDGVTSTNFRISTLPQHVFIDQKGVIYDTFAGVLGKEELLKKLEPIN